MKGTVLAVNISDEKGEKKHNVGKCRLLTGLGLESDAHIGFMHRQVSLLSKQSIQKIIDKGLDVGYGDFAENLTIEGIDLPSLPVGTEMKVGKEVLLKVTQIGKECHSRCNIFFQVGDCVMPKEGIFAEVLTEGEVEVGDEIVVLL